MARPRHPLLSRERIVEAALALMDSEGLQALSTRRLAAELGVSGPSLYNHFATKEEILDAAADSVVAQVDLSMFGSCDWRVALRRWGRSYRAALAAHPNIVPFLAQGPGRRPASLRLANAVFGGLRDAGWPVPHATRIGAMMRYFIAGSALGSFARGFVDDADLYRERYPALAQAHLLPRYQQEVDELAFEVGLEALISGLSLRYEAVVGPLPPLPDEPTVQIPTQECHPGSG
ncbi:TetR family transcriptional regulator [Wenjunlia vitaminophila]|uniref:TetR family transcriptional regulator n=1 Tax=Wenjunlia vitaminophila TaxID=76728 RepID=A0A0T6LWY6_WENVI|nr:TetR/AcrR family transcriptional regulator [Wenjunlia vitaminophila]KRV50520.1 TetR family transcriptional regulator [Wenjunlia vitaminophila]